MYYEKSETITKMNLLVFDIDNTLTKSEIQHQFAFVETMKHFGITKIDEDWTGYEHMTDSYILKVNHDANLSTDFTSEFVDTFEAVMMESISTLQPCSEVAGAGVAIKQILDHPSFSVCFATGSLLAPALLKLDQAKLGIEESLVIGSNRFLTREEIVKASVNKAKSYYNVDEFEHIISVGDGIWDWKTAQNLGLHFIGIGNENKEEFQNQAIPFHIADWQNFEIDLALEKLGIRR